jgi:hypothetical protein
MPASTPDPALVRKTKVSHLVLFIFATLLTLPAGFVFMVLPELLGLASFKESAMLVAAAIPSLTGVIAWIALGLLMTRPAYPHWHLACWPFVILFGITAVPGCLYWLTEESNPDSFITWIVLFALVAAIASIAVAIRNLRIARASLGKQQQHFQVFPRARA